MKLSKALKEKNRIIKEMSTCLKRAVESNSVIEGATPTYSSKEQLDEGMSQLDELVAIKAKIQKANEPIQHRIFKLSELKNTISKLRHMSTADGVQAPSYGQETSLTYIAEIKRLDLDKLIEGYEKEIDTIQEELDTFNHTTNI